MEWNEGGKWDNSNSIINKIYLKKKRIINGKKLLRNIHIYLPIHRTSQTQTLRAFQKLSILKELTTNH